MLGLHWTSDIYRLTNREIDLRIDRMSKVFEIIPIARKKLSRRGISEAWVEETINLPDQTLDGYGGRKVAQKKYVIEQKEYLLRVIYEEKGEINLVITGYLTSHIERYWQEGKDENRI